MKAPEKQSNFWARYIRFTSRFDWLFVAVCLVSVVASLLYVRKIEIRSDFKEMLPDKYESVIQLNRIEKRVKSSGNLIVMVGGENWPAMRHFINDFVFRAKAAMPADIADIEYNAREVHQFYDTNKYLYIDLDDLEEVYTRLKRQIDYEKLKESPFYIDFSDEPPKFDISDIEDKYQDKTSNYQHYEDGYFTNEKVNLAAILVKPREGSTDVAFSEHLIAGLQKVIDDLNPSSYDPSIKTGFGGRYKKMIEQYRALVSDILTTVIICVVMVGLILLVYFKRLRMGIWTTIVVMLGVLLTLSIARFAIGYLTSQTAFLGSIIVGNGINYGLIVLARYLEERRGGKSIIDSLSTATGTTWRATITSSLSTSGAFVVLAFTEIKGFSQFGVIGSIGMLMCWITTYAFLPSFVSLTERLVPLDITKISPRNIFWFIGAIGRISTQNYKKVLAASSVAIFAAGLLVAWYLPRSLEYDFSKLRFEPAKHKGSAWEANAREELNNIFGQSTTPSVILADKTEDVRAICKSIEEKALASHDEDVFDECKTIYNFVPADQDEKLRILADIRELLSGSTLAFLSESQKREVEKFRETFDLKSISLSDVPEEITVNFEEVDGRRGLIAYVYSKPSANLWHGKHLVRFADLIRKINLPDGRTIFSSGESVIFSDLLQAVIHQGPKITLYSLCLVMLIVFLNYRWSLPSVLMLSTLVAGALWMVAFLAITGIKLNFLNFVALPITFGIGIDYSVNIYQRYALEGKGSMPMAVATTGAAVALCSSTTVIGYSALMISSSRALQSFGFAAVLGELCTSAAALIAMPAFVAWLEKRKG